jgi:hypothetical protein
MLRLSSIHTLHVFTVQQVWCIMSAESMLKLDETKKNDQMHKTLTFKAKNPASHIPVDKPP